MKRLLIQISTTLLLLCTLLSSCENQEPIKKFIEVTNKITSTQKEESSSKEKETKEYTVIFHYNNETNETYSKQVEENKTISQPQDPIKENYIFTGWYADHELYQKYDFSKPVKRDISLYAGYTIDAASITNLITSEVIKAIVTIENKCYNKKKILGFEIDKIDEETTSQGTGVIFYFDNNTRYCILTNNHVAQKKEGYKYQEITIIDHKGRRYKGTEYSNPKNLDPNYDLAIINLIVKDNAELQTLKIAKENPKTNNDVISLGSPGNQSNSITFGKIQRYTKITLKETPKYLSNVSFEVIEHDAFIKGGSSGGPLINDKMEIVGINYAGSKNNFYYGYSIPAEQIHEFLKECFFAYDKL